MSRSKTIFGLIGWLLLCFAASAVGAAIYAGGMVYCAKQARVESAGMDLRAGLDSALRDDGGGGLACVAVRRFCHATPSARDVSGAVGAQRTMDAALLRPAPTGGLAFAEIILLWMAILVTLLAFWPVSRSAT